MSSGSAMMSESTTVITCAGAHSWAKRPPLTAESRLRMVFISTMSAPLASNWEVISCSSAPGMRGFSNSAEPPPEIRQSTVSSAVSPRTRDWMRRAASSPAASGTGWAASTTSMRRHGTA